MCYLNKRLPGQSSHKNYGTICKKFRFTKDDASNSRLCLGDKSCILEYAENILLNKNAN